MLRLEPLPILRPATSLAVLVRAQSAVCPLSPIKLRLGGLASLVLDLVELPHMLEVVRQVRLSPFVLGLLLFKRRDLFLEEGQGHQDCTLVVRQRDRSYRPVRRGV